MSFVTNRLEGKFLKRLSDSRSEIVGLVEVAAQVRLLSTFLLPEECSEINLSRFYHFNLLLVKPFDTFTFFPKTKLFSLVRNSVDS